MMCIMYLMSLMYLKIFKKLSEEKKNATNIHRDKKGDFETAVASRNASIIIWSRPNDKRRAVIEWKGS